MSEVLCLLDTSVVLHLVRGGDLGRRIDATYGLSTASARPLVCIVTHGEAQVIARRTGWGEQKMKALQRAIDSLVTVDISAPAIIDAYVELDLISQASSAGARNMGKNDLWIAAAAHAAGARLLTTDRDFDHLIPDHLDGDVIAPLVATAMKA
jgi:predicted nucleic acid-binding protein